MVILENSKDNIYYKLKIYEEKNIVVILTNNKVLFKD
jgi:hypothetical protein